MANENKMQLSALHVDQTVISELGVGDMPVHN